MRAVERWRRLIGHEGYLLVELRVLTPAEGGRSRALQTGYHAVWWQPDDQSEGWPLGSGPIDLLAGQRSLRPGQSGPVAVRPMDPAPWRDVDAGAVLHLRERAGQTLGVADVVRRVDLPEDAPLRLDAVPLRPGAVALTEDLPTWSSRFRRVLGRPDPRRLDRRS